MSLLSEDAARVLHELDVYVVRAGLAIDQRALRCLDELANLHADYEAELDRLLGLHDEYLTNKPVDLVGDDDLNW